MTAAAFAYPITPHLAGSTGTADDEFADAREVGRVLRDCTLVQEKVDGLNLGLRVRGHCVQAVLKDRYPDAAEWQALSPLVTAVAGPLRRLHAETGGIRVFGELLDPGRAVLDNWRIFDVFDEAASRFWAHRRVIQAARCLSVRTVPVLHYGPLHSMAQLRDLADGVPEREGVVLRLESGGWLRERFKYVGQGFRKTSWSVR